MTSFAHERYKTKIASLFEEDKVLDYILLVERELAYANYKTGKITQAAYEEIAEYATREYVTLQRVKELEEETHHDVMSVVLAINEQCPNYGGYVHLGATSNDIKDTVLGLQLKKAKTMILSEIDEISKQLSKLAKKHKDLVCIGRTHGQHAIPITYGFKFANYLSEIELSKETVQQATVNYGKMSGAVGTYASYGTRQIEKIAMERLGLRTLPITTQVIPRIIPTKFIFALSTIVATLERISTEIRNLQRTEIGEMYEKFSETQVGSSTMPHKRNPHKSERICGIAKYVRSMVTIELENIPLEHERDLTNSSSERLVIPTTVNLTYFALKQMLNILKEIYINEKQVKRILNLTQGRICAEQLMLALTDKIGRQKAHEILNRLADIEGDYTKAVKRSEVANYLDDKTIEKLLQPEKYIGLADKVVDQVLDRFSH